MKKMIHIRGIILLAMQAGAQFRKATLRQRADLRDVQ